jgi:4-amino-4-deoxy-L-arabinose transferase-like glycosyltransferase
MPRVDLGLALVLAALTAATRVPFRARLLTSWDAVQFTLALRDYDVVSHQPHPPGYILFVALARVVAWLVGDPAAALIWLSLIASGVTVGLVYALAWRLYGRPAAVAAAVGLAVSPLFWYYGEVGLSYTTEAALATAVALLTWPMAEGRAAFAGWSALALGVAGGVRQSILVVLLPLWLGAAVLGLRRWRPVLHGLAVLTGVTAAWLVPMVWLTGGPGRYLEAARELYASTIRATTVAGGPGAWQVNAVGLAEAAVLGLGLLLPALLAGLATALRRLPRWDGRAWFFAAWLAPPLAVYAAVHFGQHGYLLTILPACYVLLGRGLEQGLARISGPIRRWSVAAAVVALVVVGHAAFFLRAPAIEVDGVLAATPGAEGWWMSLAARYRYRLWPETAGGLRELEQVIQGFVDAVRRDLDPADTVLLTELGNPRSYPWYRHVGYYLPEFPVYHLRVGPYSPGFLASRRTGSMAALDGPEVLLPAHTRRLAWVVDYWNPTVPPPPGLRAHRLALGRWLYVLDVTGSAIEHAGYRLTPVAALARLR